MTDDKNGGPLSNALAALLEPIIRKVIWEAFEEFEGGKPTQARVLTQQQACEALQVSPPTLRKLMDTGLPFVRIGDHAHFDIEECMAWLKKRSVLERTGERPHE